MRISTFAAVVLFFLAPVCVNAQESPARLAVFDIDMTEYKNKSSALRTLLMLDLLKSNALTSIPEHLVRAYAGNRDFVVIDKINYQLIEDERERQKSERHYSSRPQMFDSH